MKITVKKFISKYGKMTTLRIDTKNKFIFVSSELHGETTPIDIQVEYVINKVQNNQQVEFKKIQISREWMNELANEYLMQTPLIVNIPQGFASSAIKVLKI